MESSDNLPTQHMSPSRTGPQEAEELTGGSWAPFAPLNSSLHVKRCEVIPMNIWKLTRRTFLGFTTSVGLMAFFGCVLPPGQSVVVYRRSGRGRHVSNAAKKHNANRLYATEQAALLDIPHPGDRSKVVPVTISSEMYNRLFAFNKQVADLRRAL